MDKQNEHLEALTEIRSMMERSSRFISLSGLSGVSAGIFALIGATIAYFHFDLSFSDEQYYKYAYTATGDVNMNFYLFCFILGISVLVCALASGIFFTIKRANKKGQGIWDSTARRLILNLFIPLAAGGLFCLALLYHGIPGLVAPATLVFYGLALLNASKYTLEDIRYLGISEIALGIIASGFMQYGLIFWSIGFGILHIVYGVVMYYKYENAN